MDTDNFVEFLPEFPNFKKGMIVEGCNLHIGPIVYFHDNDGVGVRSLFDGNISSHSLRHCGVEIQSTEEILQKLSLYKNGGIEAINELWQQRVEAMEREQEAMRVMHLEWKAEREGSGKPYWIICKDGDNITFEGHQGHWSDCFFSNATRIQIENWCESEGWKGTIIREMTDEELEKYPEALQFQQWLKDTYGEY